MKTINGISMSTATHNDLLAFHDIGKRILLGTPDGPAGGCPNCNGTGNIIATIINGGPYQSPRGGTVTKLSDGWYTIADHPYPCPLCSDNVEHPTIIGGLIADSGLVGDEVNWRLDYISGMGGKVNALTVARTLLAMTPDPTGLYTFFGAHGVGKSGLLKSLVAAFVAAGVKAKYVRGLDVLQTMRAGFNGNDNDVEIAVLESLMRYSFLAIDEVDRTSSTQWAQEAMFSLLDRRYNMRGEKATALAMNQAPDNMPIGQWSFLMSRMEDGIRCPIGGASLRGNA